MSKTVYYRQCKLVKKIEAGTRHQTSYLPEEFAKVGKIVKLRDDDGEWEDGWLVAEASSHRMADDEMHDSHDTIKGHRKATGDSKR